MRTPAASRSCCAWAVPPRAPPAPGAERQAGLPKAVRDIAWKAQLRLRGRYRKLTARGKRRGVVTAALAREMAALLWAIGREVEPRHAG